MSILYATGIVKTVSFGSHLKPVKCNFSGRSFTLKMTYLIENILFFFSFNLLALRLRVQISDNKIILDYMFSLAFLTSANTQGHPTSIFGKYLFGGP